MSATKTNARGKLSGRQWIVMVGVLCLMFIAPTFTGVNVTLAEMTRVYGVSDAAVSYVSNIAQPACMVAGLLCGLFLGRALKFKVGAIIGTGLTVLSGLIPLIWPTLPFAALLFSRVLGGLGIGTFNPIANAIIVKMFKTETARAAWLGFGSIFFSLGVTFSSTICGLLALISWQMVYAFYLLAIIPLIIFIFLFKDEYIQSSDDQEQTATEKAEEKKISVKLPGKVWAIMITFTLFLVTTQMFFNYVGLSLDKMGVNPAVIGTVFSVFTVGGIVNGFANAGIWKVLKQWQPPIMCLLMAVCYIIVIIATKINSVPLVYVGAFIGGVGCASTGLCFPVMLGAACTPAMLTVAISFTEIFRNMGGFVSTPFAQGVAAIAGPESGPTEVYIATIGLSVVVSILFFLIGRKFKPDIEAMTAREAAAKAAEAEA
jgi:MFS family permease